MSELTLQLPEDVLARLQSEAERQHIPLDDLVRAALESLRESLHDALAGRVYPRLADQR